MSTEILTYGYTAGSIGGFVARSASAIVRRPSALTYGRIIAQCRWARGRDYDRMIAAHAISSDSILVTNNEAAFRDIPGLAMENWML